MGIYFIRRKRHALLKRILLGDILFPKAPDVCIMYALVIQHLNAHINK